MKKIFSILFLMFIVSCARFDEDELYLYYLGFKAAVVAPWSTIDYNVTFFYDGTYKFYKLRPKTLIGEGGYSINLNDVITFRGDINGEVIIIRDGTGQYFDPAGLTGVAETQKFYKKK